MCGAYRRGAAALLLTIGLIACDDDDIDDTALDEPKVATIRLTVGSQTLTIDESCAVTGGPIRIATGTTPVAASFLMDNGTIDPVVTGLNFELRFNLANTGLATFTRTGPFTGTLTKTATGNTTATVTLFHFDDDDDENHSDIVCPNLALQVQ